MFNNRCNVITVITSKFIVQVKFTLLLTAMFTFTLYLLMCIYTIWKNKNKPTNMQNVECVHSAQMLPGEFVITDCKKTGFYSTRSPINSYPGQFTTNMRQYWLKHIASWCIFLMGYQSCVYMRHFHNTLELWMCFDVRAI